jgi:HAD superfamily hydrolase (TIGR01490 family)
MNSPDAAFFDVDETLIAIKSMFRFLEFYLARRGEGPETYLRLRDELGAMAAAGRPREEVNRAYYRCYAGESAAELARAGADWIAEELRRPGLLLDAATEHAGFRAMGTPTVLLSGSFFACLDPVATLLGASEAYGTPVIIRRGVLTGAVEHPMIGEAKARKVREIGAQRGYRLPRCLAYGDHPSDLPMLTSVGDAVVVGEHPVMLAAADEHDWRRLPGVSVHV